MDITYNDKVTVDGSSYIYSEGGEIVLNLGSITLKDLFSLEFDLQTNTTSSWNAPLEIEGIAGFNIQNAGYSSYFTCIWGNTSHVMDTYPITSEEYVHYHIWQQNGSIFIQITQSNGASYSYNATYNGSFSTIHLGNYHKENRATGVVKNVKFTAVNNYLDTIGLTSLWSKIKSLFATKTELGSKANDADVVHKSGDEVITGNKWFTKTSLYFNYKNVDNVRIFADSEGGNIRLTDVNGNYHYEFDTPTGDYLRLYGGNSNEELTGGFCFFPNGDLQPTQGSLQNLGSDQYKWKGVYGNVFYGVNLKLTKEIRYTDTTYDWSDTSLDTWCDAGHVSWFDRNDTRRMHELIGVRNGRWRKACYINEEQYFSIQSDLEIDFRGNNLRFNNHKIECIDSSGTDYIRYTNGLQICWGETNTTTDKGTWTFPKTFKSIPRVLFQAYGDHTNDFDVVSGGKVTTSNATYIPFRNSAGSFASYGINCFAIGFWK